jgi:hypothetical protein
MFRPSLSELNESSTIVQDPVVHDLELNHYRPSMHVPMDALPIHQLPGNRQYPSVMMDSDIGPGHMDNMNTSLTIGNPDVHTVATGKEGTLNPGDGLGIGENMKAQQIMRKRFREATAFHPDVMVPELDDTTVRGIFNSYDPRDAVSAFPMRYLRINGEQVRSRAFTEVDAGNTLPSIGVGSILDDNSTGIDVVLPKKKMKPPPHDVQTVAIQK